MYNQVLSMLLYLLDLCMKYLVLDYFLFLSDFNNVTHQQLMRRELPISSVAFDFVFASHVTVR